MVHRFYDLPSLTALEAFEALARHLSFELAASELNMTSEEISRHIKALEDKLAVPLFVELGTGAMLTNAGEDLYRVMARSFSRAADVVRTIKHGDVSGRARLPAPTRSHRCG
ncbi:LysR family transcriptional regulator [Mesorhizobium sp. M0306]|uniref:LysR family transcriptional regulator n=1 Tax=Mesorhizobium sp. M0306 TaxID=2956932 RepID=UPI00333BAE08